MVGLLRRRHCQYLVCRLRRLLLHLSSLDRVPSRLVSWLPCVIGRIVLAAVDREDMLFFISCSIPY